MFDKAWKSAGPAADPKISGIKGKCQKVFSQKEICISAAGFAKILYIWFCVCLPLHKNPVIKRVRDLFEWGKGLLHLFDCCFKCIFLRKGYDWVKRQTVCLSVCLSVCCRRTLGKEEVEQGTWRKLQSYMYSLAKYFDSKESISLWKEMFTLICFKDSPPESLTSMQAFSLLQMLLYDEIQNGREEQTIKNLLQAVCHCRWVLCHFNDTSYVSSVCFTCNTTCPIIQC